MIIFKLVCSNFNSSDEHVYLKYLIGQVGDLMLVKDHINMFGLGGLSPLQGPNDEYFGPRFFDVNQLYSDTWRQLAREAAKEVQLLF